MFGLLNVHKPVGVTSRDVVNVVQRLVRPHKTGHAGTLDPLASGVLLVAVGQATRLTDPLHRLRKRYTATCLLGRSSPTEDVEGEVTLLADPPRPTLAQLSAALPRFVGRVEQLPPQFSAVKVAGRRAYELARRGQEAAVRPRVIEVHALEIVRLEYPELQLEIWCGSGTYVRSLGRDLARAVGTEAVMSALVRTEIGPFTLADAIPLADLSLPLLSERLMPPLAALPDLPRVQLSEAEMHDVRHGRTIAARDGLAAADELAAVSPAGELAAILAPLSNGRLRPTRCFIPGADQADAAPTDRPAPPLGKSSAPPGT